MFQFYIVRLKVAAIFAGFSAPESFQFYIVRLKVNFAPCYNGVPDCFNSI